MAAAGYALGAATTTPFTGAADVVTALPIASLAVLVVVRWPLRPVPRPRRSDLPPEQTHPWRAWAVLFVVVLAWELAEYAARGSRADHPTLSSMSDAVDRTYVLKALVFFLWLWLCAAIVQKGRVPGRARRRRPGSGRVGPAGPAGPAGPEPS